MGSTARTRRHSVTSILKGGSETVDNGDLEMRPFINEIDEKDANDTDEIFSK